MRSLKSVQGEMSVGLGTFFFFFLKVFLFDSTLFYFIHLILTLRLRSFCDYLWALPLSFRMRCVLCAGDKYDEYY